MAEKIAEYRKLARDLLDDDSSDRWSHQYINDNQSYGNVRFLFHDASGAKWPVTAEYFIRDVVGPLQDPSLSEDVRFGQCRVLEHVLRGEVELRLANDLLHSLTVAEEV